MILELNNYLKDLLLYLILSLDIFQRGKDRRNALEILFLEGKLSCENKIRNRIRFLLLNPLGTAIRYFCLHSA